MSYITYDYYVSIYGSELITSEEFNNIAWQAERFIDKHTTGVDGVKKLRVAFPADEYDKECVRRCAAQLVNFMGQINAAEKRANDVRELEKTATGMHGKVISSISSGNESITFATGTQSATFVDNALTDNALRNAALADIVRENLSGVTDANGVNLLYMGVYPFVA